MLPLEGIRILDLTTLSGYCGMELADYGAEVIKEMCIRDSLLSGIYEPKTVSGLADRWQ